MEQVNGEDAASVVASELEVRRQLRNELPGLFRRLLSQALDIQEKVQLWANTTACTTAHYDCSGIVDNLFSQRKRYFALLSCEWSEPVVRTIELVQLAGNLGSAAAELGQVIENHRFLGRSFANWIDDELLYECDKASEALASLSSELAQLHTQKGTAASPNPVHPGARRAQENPHSPECGTTPAISPTDNVAS